MRLVWFDYCSQLCNPSKVYQIQRLEMVLKSFLRKRTQTKGMHYWDNTQIITDPVITKKKRVLPNYIHMENIGKVGTKYWKSNKWAKQFKAWTTLFPKYYQKKSMSKSTMLMDHNKRCEAFQLHPKENQEHERLLCSKENFKNALDNIWNLSRMNHKFPDIERSRPFGLVAQIYSK